MTDNQEDSPKEGFVDQLRALLRDGLDYLSKMLEFQQARFTAFALSGVLFVISVCIAVMLLIAAFVLFNVALGLFLTTLFDSALWSVVTLGFFYLLLAFAISFRALRWMKKLKS